MDILVCPGSQPTATHTLPTGPPAPPPDRTWLAGGALLCLLVAARLAGGTPGTGAPALLPPAAVAVPATAAPVPQPAPQPPVVSHI
jgi:hypothetical protein